MHLPSTSYISNKMPIYPTRTASLRFLGQVEAPQPTPVLTTVVVTKPGVSPDFQRQVLNILKQLPEHLLEQLAKKGLKVVVSRHYEAGLGPFTKALIAFKKHLWKQQDAYLAAGYMPFSKQLIVPEFPLADETTKLSDDPNFTMIVAHELGHSVDMLLGNGKEKTPQAPNFQKRIKKYAPYGAVAVGLPLMFILPSPLNLLAAGGLGLGLASLSKKLLPTSAGFSANPKLVAAFEADKKALLENPELANTLDIQHFTSNPLEGFAQVFAALQFPKESEAQQTFQWFPHLKKAIEEDVLPTLALKNPQ